MRAIAKLDDDNHIILSLQNAEKINKWDLAAEYVNNNLLSSPDTHILNIASGLNADTMETISHAYTFCMYDACR